MEKFLSTIYGSWLKVFLVAVLATWMAELSSGRSLFSWDLHMVESILRAGVLATVPVIINYLDPNDSRYGRK